MKSLLESLNIALFESKTVKSTVKDFFSWYFDEDFIEPIEEGITYYVGESLDIYAKVEFNELYTFYRNKFRETINMKYFRKMIKLEKAFNIYYTERFTKAV